MAYENEIRPATRPGSELGRRADTTSYAFPVIALLLVLGFGMWFASRDVTPTPSTTTIERTTPAPSAPVIPAPIIPAPSTPK